MRGPLMITPLGHDTHPHFKPPLPQGWSLRCHGIAVDWLERREAKRMRRRQCIWRDGLDTETVREVGEKLGNLLAQVATGSELLYDGLPVSSLD